MPSIPLLFGRFLVKAGWITEAQAERALSFQREQHLDMGLVAILEGLLTVDGCRRVLECQRQTGLLFHEAVLKLGLLDVEQLALLDTRRRSQHLLLGAVLVIQKSLSATALQDAIHAFTHYTNTGVMIPCTSPSSSGQEEVP
ncbi:MAG TPA: hypothetical protein VIH59_20720 [Candidatus Tectomicrobia bacterium]